MRRQLSITAGLNGLVPAGLIATVVAVGHPAAAAAECPPLGDRGDDAEGALVVLVDGTASIGEQTGRVADLVRLVDETTADREISVAVGSFGGSDAEVRFSGCLDGDMFVPEGNNARTRERNRPTLLEGLSELVAGLPTGYETSDPTSALRAGVGRLADVADDEPRVLVIHTDGIPTTGCAALPERVELTDDGAPELIDSLLAGCSGSGRLPSADGVDVVIAGVGRARDDLDADAVTFLLDLNRALCEATGATCRVDPNLPRDVWPDTEAD